MPTHASDIEKLKCRIAAKIKDLSLAEIDVRCNKSHGAKMRCAKHVTNINADFNMLAKYHLMALLS